MVKLVFVTLHRRRAAGCDGEEGRGWAGVQGRRLEPGLAWGLQTEPGAARGDLRRKQPGQGDGAGPGLQEDLPGQAGPWTPCVDASPRGVPGLPRQGLPLA